MKLSIMQPYLFPYLGYWQMISNVDEFVLYDDVNFIKGGWINRNNILINGNAKMFTLPLLNASPNKLIKEINVTDNINQKQKLLRMFQMTYSKAPYFKEIMPLLEKIINFENLSLAIYLKNHFEVIFDYLNIKTKLTLSSDIEKTEGLHAQSRVIDICKRIGTTQYINAIGGQELYNKEEFKKEGIELNFIKMNRIRYKQFNNEFVPNLSIIDVLMFNNKKELKNLLKAYILI
ncbi:MAG: WbqC family protein [Candidatus Gastranaerophilaceae bacterium]